MRRYAWFGLAFVGLLWLGGFATQPTHAQTSGTMPAGTIPDQLLYLPLVASPARLFDAIFVLEPPIDRPAATNGDINLALRGYTATVAALTVIDVGGDVDDDAPQLDGLFAVPRLPTFQAAYQVYDWNWACSADGCRGASLVEPPITLLEMAVTPGEPLFIPTRNAPIDRGGYKALVLYAEAQRITVAYTRQDTPAVGYLIHIEDVTVEPALLTLYNALNAAGRAQLPALRNRESFGVATGTTIKVAVRDTGSFLDPRVRKDWWKSY